MEETRESVENHRLLTGDDHYPGRSDGKWFYYGAAHIDMN